MITLLSVVILGEKVELPRWLVLLVGFVCVMLIVRPGSATFNVGSLFILISVLFYTLTVMVTRKLHTTESSAMMAYSIDKSRDEPEHRVSEAVIVTS